jgi:hypothetical protein
MDTAGSGPSGQDPAHPGLVLDFDESFAGSSLDLARWLPWYLPHWSSRASAAARYDLTDGHLRLRIDADQAPWCPDGDGDTRVSSLQTAIFAGPVGSTIGQHRFRDGLVVREAQPPEQRYTMRGGRIELRARALADPRCMVALWLIGVEDEPDRAGELCVMEIFGSAVEPGRAIVGMGIHPHRDPTLVDDFEHVPLDGEATDWHRYAAEWLPGGSAVYEIDGVIVKRSGRAPTYPLQLMLGVYEFASPAGSPDPDPRPDVDYPKVFEVDWIRGYALDPA